MDELIKLLHSCNFTELYKSAIGITPEETKPSEEFIEYALMYDYENNTLFLLNYAFTDGHSKNTLKYGWESSIKHPRKQIGTVSAQAIKDGGLPNSLIGYINQGRK